MKYVNDATNESTPVNLKDFKLKKCTFNVFTGHNYMINTYDPNDNDCNNPEVTQTLSVYKINHFDPWGSFVNMSINDPSNK
uniref:Uncharacterized protein n=1 Tax=uncultured organism MedDCM-OCT-S08-C100 TaxID=743626 RepID=D6PJ50_9ZZZZ|nr:hypothetical protein [uncultured organism MedDCM-OCT-S08-C100]